MRIKHLVLGALTAFPFIFVASATAQQAAIYSSKDRFHPVYAANGMVASQEALATRIGVSILEQGGNAVDAGAAVAFALAVTLPRARNIGGDGFTIIHHADWSCTSLVDT